MDVLVGRPGTPGRGIGRLHGGALAGQDTVAAGITLAAGIVLPFVYPPLRRGIASSPLLRVGASALLSSRAASDQ